MDKKKLEELLDVNWGTFKKLIDCAYPGTQFDDTNHSFKLANYPSYRFVYYMGTTTLLPYVYVEKFVDGVWKVFRKNNYSSMKHVLRMLDRIRVKDEMKQVRLARKSEDMKALFAALKILAPEAVAVKAKRDWFTSQQNVYVLTAYLTADRSVTVSIVGQLIKDPLRPGVPTVRWMLPLHIRLDWTKFQLSDVISSLLDLATKVKRRMLSSTT